MASSSDAGKSRSVSTKGQHGEDAPQRPFVIGVAGGSASGKTTVCSQIMSSLDARVCLVAADSFYKTLDRESERPPVFFFKPLSSHMTRGFGS